MFLKTISTNLTSSSNPPPPEVWQKQRFVTVREGKNYICADDHQTHLKPLATMGQDRGCESPAENQLVHGHKVRKTEGQGQFTAVCTEQFRGEDLKSSLVEGVQKRASQNAEQSLETTCGASHWDEVDRQKEQDTGQAHVCQEAKAPGCGQPDMSLSYQGLTI